MYMNFIKLKLLLIVTVFFSLGFNTVPEADNNPSYRYRKYNHVKKFYQRLAAPVTELCVEHKVPPAIILSILSLESGWGKGYVGQITGNFLSLNATKSETELPALRMPKCLKTGKIIVDSKHLSKMKSTDYVWQNRPSSLKKDYRPKGMAGTKQNLDYFLQHPEELTKANLKNVKDFVSRFISKSSRIKAYREARALLDTEIAKHGIDVLFTDELNEKFVYTIGGKPNSYNSRKTWPKKVMSIYRNVGANQLTQQIYLEQKSFEGAW